MKTVNLIRLKGGTIRFEEGKLKTGPEFADLVRSDKVAVIAQLRQESLIGSQDTAITPAMLPNIQRFYTAVSTYYDSGANRADCREIVAIMDANLELGRLSRQADVWRLIAHAWQFSEASVTPLVGNELLAAAIGIFAPRVGWVRYEKAGSVTSCDGTGSE